MKRRQFLVASAAALTSPLGSAVVGHAGARTPGSAKAVPVVRGALRRLTAPAIDANRATYLPDGNTLLYASKQSGRSQIWSMEPDGRNVRQIHHSSANDFGRVAPNADGTRLGFSSDRSGQNSVYVLDRNTGRITLLSDPGSGASGRPGRRAT